MGLKPSEVEQMANAYNKKMATPEGFMESSQVAEQQRLGKVAQGIGLSPEEIAQAQGMATEAPIDWAQAGLSSLIGGGGTALARMALRGALGGAGVGAVGGGVGAAAGVLLGLTTGLISNIKSQQRGQIGAANDELSAAKTNMRQLATLASKDPSNAETYVQLYNDQLKRVWTAYAKVKLETSGNLNKFMEDGTDILSDYSIFLREGGQADLYGQRLSMALVDPSSLTFSEQDFIDAGMIA
jgi:hypothetical protein